MNTELLWRFSAITFLSSLSLSTSVSAQDSPSTSQTVGASIEEIVVTARRKEEDLQSVPLAISAMTSETLFRESITTAQDLMGKIPSMTIGANGAMRNSEAANIRGQGATFGANPGVAMYWAEVPLPLDSFTNNQGGPGMFFDLENLQVLKGPQGTLFGRNTTGGALILEPARPKDMFSAKIQAETGNFDHEAYEFVLNTPIIPDTLLLRLGGQRSERDGYTEDVFTDKDYDDRNYWTGRLGLTLRLGDRVENTIMAYRTMRNEHGTGNIIDEIDPYGLSDFIVGFIPFLSYNPNLPPQGQIPCLFFNGETGSTNCGQDIVDAQAQRGIRETALSADPFDKLETGAYIDLFSWEINDQFTLRNIVSKAYYKRNFSWDQDGSIAALNDINAIDNYSSDTTTTTEELQLHGNLADLGLTFVTGAYYEKRTPESVQETTTIALFFPVTQRIDTTNRSKAIYAQSSLDMGFLSPALERWTLTAGARRTVDEVEGYSYFKAFIFERDNDSEYRKYATTWLLSASYQQDDDTMWYGKVTRGYKAGGFTGLAPNPANFFYDPEYVTNYELGLKTETDIYSMPLRMNSAIYYSDYTDMQRITSESYTDPVTGQSAFGATIFNAGKSVIQGFETDFILIMSEWLRLSGNYSYTDGEFKQFNVPRSSLRPQNACNGSGLTGGAVGDYSCLPFTDVPEHQYSLSLIFTLPLDPAIGTIDTSITYAWVDDRYTAPITLPEDEPGAWLDDYSVVNASIMWRDIFSSRLDLQIFGTNLTDEEYRVNNSNAWNELAFRNTIWSEPRMYGLRVTYRFGDE